MMGAADHTAALLILTLVERFLCPVLVDLKVPLAL